MLGVWTDFKHPILIGHPKVIACDSMDIEEAMRLMEARLIANELAKNEANWEEGRVTLLFERAPDDPQTFTAEYQAELSHVTAAFREAELEAQSRVMALDSVESFGGQLGEFAIPIAKYGTTALAGIVTGWLKARAGRTVRVEFFADGTPKKIEAATPEAVVAMFEAVKREAKTKPKKGK